MTWMIQSKFWKEKISGRNEFECFCTRGLCLIRREILCWIRIRCDIVHPMARFCTNLYKPILHINVEDNQIMIWPRERAYQNTPTPIESGWRIIGLMDWQGQTWWKRGEKEKKSPILADFDATENAIARELLWRYMSCFAQSRVVICARSSRCVCMPDVSHGLRKSTFEQKNGTFINVHVFVNNFATKQNIHIMTTGIDSARDLESSLTRPSLR